jgi:hypothetical protein
MTDKKWDDLLISSKASQNVKDKLNNINSLHNQKDEKYIGIIPIYWDSLNIMKKNQSLKNYDLIELDKVNISFDDDIQNIYITKTKLLIERGFCKQNINHYPVYKFPNNISFTMREITNKIKDWLSEDGFMCDEIDAFRIYKMAGFHVFAVILHTKPIKTKLKNDWEIMYGLELLSVEDKEIVNPIMKISQDKFQYQLNNYTISSDWTSSMVGYLKEYNEIIPYELKWDEVIATLANLIDSNADNNLHLYFTANILVENDQQLFFNKKQKIKK